MKNIISIDLGGTNLRVALLDENLNIRDIKRVPTIVCDTKLLSETIINLIDEIVKEQRIKKIDAIGMSYCGIVENNILKNAKNLGVESFDLRSELLKKYPNTKIRIANDANCASYAESKYGTAKGKDVSVFVTISTGIGMGVTYNGQLLDLPLETGRNIIEYKGKLYESENLLSGRGIITLCSLNDLNVPDAKTFFDMVKSRDALALKVYDIWIKYISMWFANVQLAYNADIFVLSGGVLNSGDFFIEDIERVANAYIAMWHFKKIVMKYSTFKQDVGIIGGASLALDLLN